MNNAEMGLIGGTGLYALAGLEDRATLEIDTPYGAPSGPVVVGILRGRRIAFIPRHGSGHRISPAEVPARANIWALKSLGVTRVVSLSAVGSLREDIRPLDFIVPDQLIDRTGGRPSTFFGDGVVAHVPFAEPFCPLLSKALGDAIESVGATVVRGGTYLAMEGPAFSTRAESELYRSWQADVIGMTALPEAKLAREAELCYATMGAVTDYDCWHETEEAVNVETVVRNLRRNVDTAQSAIDALISSPLPDRHCICANALKGAIMTSLDAIPARRKGELELLAGKYLGR